MTTETNSVLNTVWKPSRPSRGHQAQYKVRNEFVKKQARLEGSCRRPRRFREVTAAIETAVAGSTPRPPRSATIQQAMYQTRKRPSPHDKLLGWSLMKLPRSSRHIRGVAFSSWRLPPPNISASRADGARPRGQISGSKSDRLIAICQWFCGPFGAFFLSEVAIDHRCHRLRWAALSVMTGSASDESIQSVAFSGIRDCFVELGIGRAHSRARWLSTTTLVV